jgi:aryl-alcohol dehydrogenase-like predicted oxidoreductase
MAMSSDNGQGISKMKYRLLGATGLRVSEIGFGGWGIGGSGNGAVAYGPTEDRESSLTLRRAFDLGVNFYDTSDFYGLGHSEELIGEALKEVRPQVILATKVGLLDPSGGQDFSPPHIRRSVEGSLRRLQTDYIDLYQLHSPSMDVLRQDNKILPAFHSLQTEGKIRALGISVRSPDDGLLAVTRFGFKAIQVNFNLVDQRAAEIGLLTLCEEENVGVIVRTPLCFGFLTGQYSEADQFDASDHRSRWPSEQIKRWAGANPLFSSMLGKREMQTHGQIALRFCLSYPSVSTAIPGMLTREHVQENVLASELGGLSQSELLGIRKTYRENRFFLGKD